MPKEYRYLYPNPKNIKEKYANSTYLSDLQLKVFFNELNKRKYLNNNLVIITSDHGFPVGDHKLKNNELGFYDDSFRIPFLLLWKGKIKPQRVKKGVYSHIDIAPTLVDLLRLSLKQNSFQGTSIFSPDHKDIHYLVQPYNGRYLSVIDYPFKYIKHLRTQRKYLFNLETDPQEINNLIELNKVPLQEIQTWEKKLDYLIINQQLIHNNQIWKEKPVPYSLKPGSYSSKKK